MTVIHLAFNQHKYSHSRVNRVTSNKLVQIHDSFFTGVQKTVGSLKRPAGSEAELKLILAKQT